MQFAILMMSFILWEVLNNLVIDLGNSTNEQSYLRKCEKYDSFSNKWFRIADCNVGSTGSSLTQFNHLYLFKFGGKIDTFT